MCSVEYLSGSIPLLFFTVDMVDFVSQSVSQSVMAIFPLKSIFSVRHTYFFSVGAELESRFQEKLALAH